jgi:SAM-dependent methyltransferase
VSGAPKPPPPLALQKAVGGIYPAAALLAGLELGVFDALGARRLSAEALAAERGVADAIRLAALLDALVVHGFLERDASGYANGAEARRYLVAGAPGFIGPIAPVYAQIFRGVLSFADAVRTGRPSAERDFAAEGGAAFLDGLHATAVAAGRDLVRRLDLAEARHLVDLGCGSAGLAIAACEALPALAATAIDLPGVAELAQARVARAGLASRIAVVAGDALAGPLALGRPADVVAMRALLQVLGPAECRKAVTNAAASLRSGGILAVIGAVLDDDSLAPVEAVGFNIALMSLFPAGRAHTMHAHADWFAAAGLGSPERVALPGANSLVWARKP